jgi:soluble lytic murein transglycosylase-like protein
MTRVICAAHLAAAIAILSFAPGAFAAEPAALLDGEPALAAPIKAEEGGFDEQAISPPPGETEFNAGTGIDRAIEFNEQDVVETGKKNPVDLPSVLKPADVTLYREIFALQDKARWKEADKLIAKLSDRLLVGHVHFERYMQSKSYRASYSELCNWLSEFRDHPGADQVYHLAQRRRTKGSRAPVMPIVDASSIRRPKDAYEGRATFHALSATQQRYVRQTQRNVRVYVHRGQPARALALINSPKSQHSFDRVSLDESRAHIASGFFHAGDNRKALELGGPAADRSGKHIPAAYWWSGLAAWRLGDYDRAANLFSAMAQSGLKSEWTVAAAAYWAARAHLVGQQPQQVNRYLHMAAKHPRTFYGMLAIRSLGTEPPLVWDRPKVDAKSWEALKREPQARRAIGLIQVGQDESAERELKSVAGTLSRDAGRALVNVAIEYNLPSLALRTGRILSEKSNENYDLALYPIPDWEPRNGFTIDRALVFAVMRQESNFRTRAKSHAGARGLMQLMPRTASFMSGKRSRDHHGQQLFDPELNMSLGQKYVEHLLEDPSIDGDLFFTVAAYNGGPGNLRKWRRRTDFQGDPLLFIESIPLFETRDYVERVLTNLWIYRYRLGQPAPELDAITAGEWPNYTPLDNKPSAEASGRAAGL